MPAGSRLRSTRFAAFALRWALLLAAWQGPIPWCHCHVGGHEGSLERHLRSHHAGHEPFAECCWHLHIILPDSPAHRPDDSSDDHYQRLPMLLSAEGACVDVLAPAIESRPLDALLATCSERAPTVCASVLRAPQHFYDGFAPQLSVPQRFGVARC